MKAMYRISLMVAAVAMLTTSAPVLAFASDTDARIESSAKKSYVFQKYLKDEAITSESKDGAVTLTGSVIEEHCRSLAQETVANLPGVKSVDNRLELKGDHANTQIEEKG